ncbi:MAG: hypothetical protein Q9162_004353 [Coniocarpon cinnabarinum]
MYSESHSILAQVPLTVSPFVSLPTATTLPYTYRSLPSSLPPSSTGDQTGDTAAEKPKFVVSSSGQAVHPDEILASCQHLQTHLTSLAEDAKRRLNAWENAIDERELAEKRRLAPGWLDRNERMLQPSSMQPSGYQTFEPLKAPSLQHESEQTSEKGAAESTTAGEELDRAFGTMDMR